MKKTTHFIGLGGAGCNILEYFFKNDLEGKYTFITEQERPYLSPSIHFIPFYAPAISHIKSDGSIVKLKADLSEELILPAEVEHLLNKDDFYVIVAGIGGYTGTMFSEQLTQVLREKGRDFMGLFCFPFFFQSEIRKDPKVVAVMQQLKALPESYCFDLGLETKSNRGLSLTKYFDKVNDDFYNHYLSTIDKSY